MRVAPQPLVFAAWQSDLTYSVSAFNTASKAGTTSFGRLNPLFTETLADIGHVVYPSSLRGNRASSRVFSLGWTATRDTPVVWCGAAVGGVAFSHAPRFLPRAVNRLAFKMSGAASVVVVGQESGEPVWTEPPTEARQGRQLQRYAADGARMVAG